MFEFQKEALKNERLTAITALLCAKPVAFIFSEKIVVFFKLLLRYFTKRQAKIALIVSRSLFNFGLNFNFEEKLESQCFVFKQQTNFTSKISALSSKKTVRKRPESHKYTCLFSKNVFPMSFVVFV